MIEEFNAREFDITKEVPEFDFERQKAEGQELLGRFSEKIGGQETLTAAADRFENQLNLRNLREQDLRLGEVSEDITSSLFGLPEQIAGTTRESLLTESQRGQLLQSKAQPLQENLARISSAQAKTGARLSAAEQQLGLRLGLQQAELDRELLPFEREFTILESQQAREFSGYTFREQAELDRLISNQGTAAGLSNSERTRLNQLAIAEAGFRNALDQIRLRGTESRKTQAAPTSSQIIEGFASRF